MTLENCFKTQTAIELVLQTFPQLIIQSQNNNKATVGWSGIATLSMLVIVAMFIKNVGYLTLYSIRRLIDRQDDAPMRPKAGLAMSRLEMEAFQCIQAYLIDPQDDGCDQNGNTKSHQLVKNETDFGSLHA